MTNENLILSDLYELARQAHYGTSFDPEKRAKSIVVSHSQELSKDLANMPEGERKRYEENYRKYLSDYLRAHSRCVSSMIAGPSNFPVARMRKYSDWADNKMRAFIEWREKALKAVERKKEALKSPEQKTDERFAQISRKIKSSAQTIIAIDTGLERGYSRQLFVNSITGVINTLARNGETELVSKCLKLVREINNELKEISEKPIISDKNLIWKLEEIAESMREYMADKSAQENEEVEVNGIKIVNNHEADRVQIFFPDKPDYETISKLKKQAWKWSPFNGCWQRKLTENAKDSAKQILSE